MSKLPKACEQVLSEPVSSKEISQMCPTVSEEFGSRMVKMAELLGLTPMEFIEISGWANSIKE